MKGKKFLVIMTIFIMLVSIQTITALEDADLNQTLEVEGDEVIELSDDTLQESDEPLQADVLESDDDLQSDDLLESSDEDILSITPGEFVYGVDYDTNYADSDTVPLERFFKAIYYGLRDYMKNNPTATREWDVFLNNKTFTGGYGDAGVGTIKTGYSADEVRVNYMALTRLAYYGTDKIPLTVHIYGGKTKNDGLKSTFDLTSYGASYAFLDMCTGNSSITGINFRNFNVNDHPATLRDIDTPFIRLGDSSQAGASLVNDCTFENIILNPDQPLVEIGSAGGNIHYDLDGGSGAYSLYSFFNFIFAKVTERIGNQIDLDVNVTTTWNVFMDGHTFSNSEDNIYYGFNSGYNGNSNERLRYLSFRDYFKYAKGHDIGDITVNIYGGSAKKDNKMSTVDLSMYKVGPFIMDLSGSSSSMANLRFMNFKLDTSSYQNTANPMFIFGTPERPNNQSSIINCIFENITARDYQPIIKLTYADAPREDSVKMMTGGLVENCTFRNNHGSQMLMIGGAVNDKDHSDDGPVFYGFRANNNTFINNKGTMDVSHTYGSMGLCFKLWNEVFNVTLTGNRFINNTNAVHGAAYCIIGSNIIIRNNYIEANEAVYGAGIESHVGNISIYDSVFINNRAAGHHDYDSHRDGSGAGIALLGENNYISNCTFTGNTAENDAGAIYVSGNNTTVTKSRFTGNNATLGAAITFLGNDNNVYDSNFTDNTVSGIGGAIYILGDDSLITASRFDSNTAADYGGAVFADGHNARLEDSYFKSNEASYGGAVYVNNTGNVIGSSEFRNNIARNGSAVYNKAKNTRFVASTFIRNQASSYMLKVNTTRVAYKQGENVEVNVYEYIAGDNILNAIHNALDADAVTLNNVAYIINDDETQIVKTPAGDVTPKDGAFDGEVYEDSLERYQRIVVEIYKQKTSTTGTGLLGANEDYELVKNQTVQTGLNGDNTFKVSNLAPGNYKVLAYHPEDENYKYIDAENTFTVEPEPDLSITKTVTDTLILLGDSVAFTITVSNAGDGINATNVKIAEILPEGLTYKSHYTPNGTYSVADNVWTIGSMANGSTATLCLIFDTTRVGVFNNTVTVNCSEDDRNLSNNNATVQFEVSTVNLTIEKTVIGENTVNIGDEVTFKIRVRNPSMFGASEVIITDIIPEGLEFISCSDERYDNETNQFYEEYLESNGTIEFTITFKATKTGNITNTANVKCNQNETLLTSSADVKVTEPVASLNVTKEALDTIVYLGQDVRFKITVKNTGNVILTGVYVKEIMPDGLRYNTFTGSNWSRNGNTFHYNAPLAVGESVEFTIVATATRYGFLNNTVIAGSNETGEENASANVTVQVEDVLIVEPPISDPTIDVIGEGDSAEGEGSAVAQMDEKATGNPLVILLLSLLAIIPLSRRRK